jgi:hypothetical protein
MMRPIDTANWPTTRKLRSRPEPLASAVDLFAFSTCAGWKRLR